MWRMFIWLISRQFQHFLWDWYSLYSKVISVPWFTSIFECRTTGTMDNWYHAIFEVGGQLGPSTYVKVNNWYHQVFPEWTTGTTPFLTWVDNWDHLFLTWCSWVHKHLHTTMNWMISHMMSLGSQASSHHKGLKDSSHDIPGITSIFPPQGIEWFPIWCSWVHKHLPTTRDLMISHMIFMGSQASSHHKGLNDFSHDVPGFTSLFPPQGIEWFLTWCVWDYKHLHTTVDWMISHMMSLGSQASLHHKGLNDFSHDVSGITSIFTPQWIEWFLTWCPWVLKHLHTTRDWMISHTMFLGSPASSYHNGLNDSSHDVPGFTSIFTPQWIEWFHTWCFWDYKHLHTTRDWMIPHMMFLGSQAYSHHKGLNVFTHDVSGITSIFTPQGIEWFLTWCSWVHKHLHTTMDWMISHMMFLGSQASSRHKGLNDSSHDVPGFTSIFPP